MTSTHRAILFAFIGAGALVSLGALTTETRGVEQNRVGDVALKEAILAAEDARAPRPDDLTPLLEGVRSESPAVQQLAVRALGRLERSSLAPHIVPLLSASAPPVRAEAANALGQALQRAGADGGAAVSAVVGPLLECLKIETAAIVRAAIYETLGRLPLGSAAEVREIETLLAEGTREGDKDPTFAVRLGAAEGLESLFRLQATKGTAAPTTVDRLRQIIRGEGRSVTAGGLQPAPTNPTGQPEEDPAAQMRRRALGALIAAGGADADTIRATVKDRDMQVRRLAAVAAGSADAMTRLGWAPPASMSLGVEGRKAVITDALGDRAPMVRYEALQAYAAHFQATSCGPIIAATKDAGPHVALLAIDLLAKECPAAEKSKVVDTLTALARDLPDVQTPATGVGVTFGSDNRVPWHRAAHALVPLASVSEKQAAALLARFASHPVWQVRMYAARAAATLGDGATLERLASDAHDNVRSTAIAALSRVKGHEADQFYIAALGSTDHQLIRAAARALDGSPNRSDATSALTATLARLTAQKRENSRDARAAVLDRIAQLGVPEQTDDLLPYLTDFDARIAARAAEALTKWTGHPHKAAPVRLTVPPPTVAELDGLVSAKARVSMRSGGTFELELLPWEAAATVTRFVRLARSGYYSGLTFHRVVPNWVIQGGSPGANEFVGDGPFMRDEVGLRPHARGALGISTRGRDTGDAQIFVNLCDNFRLDHGYTVFGEIIKGLEVVDGVLEGDVIEKIEIVTASGRRGTSARSLLQ